MFTYMEILSLWHFKKKAQTFSSRHFTQKGIGNIISFGTLKCHILEMLSCETKNLCPLPCYTQQLLLLFWR